MNLLDPAIRELGAGALRKAETGHDGLPDGKLRQFWLTRWDNVAREVQRVLDEVTNGQGDDD